MASAIHYLKDIPLSLIEISEILIEKIFRNEISQQDWSFDESEDPNLVWSNWKTKFLRVVNSHAPIRTRRAKLNNLPWIRRGQITVEITQQIVLKVIINGEF